MVRKLVDQLTILRTASLRKSYFTCKTINVKHFHVNGTKQKCTMCCLKWMPLTIMSILINPREGKYDLSLNKHVLIYYNFHHCTTHIC